MIKPLTGTDLTSTKTRSGMASLSELLPRLIRSYELQAELMQRRAEHAGNQTDAGSSMQQGQQSTFAWYE
ncbi:MAG: hypothetical protein AAFN77_10275 [Planctomycetota bacterium]